MSLSLGRINAMIIRHIYMIPRTLESWAESIYWPVVNLLIWGLTTRWVESSPGSVPRLALIVLTGVVFWQVVWRANYEISVNLLEEFWNQNLVNLFATPLSIWEWSISLVVLGLIKNILTLVVGIGTVWLLYRLSIFDVGWMLLPFLFSLMMSGWFMGFTSSALIIYYGRRLQSLAWILGFALAPLQRRVLSPECVAGLGPADRDRPADDTCVRGYAPDPQRRPAAVLDALAELRAQCPLFDALDPLLRMDVREEPGQGAGTFGMISPRSSEVSRRERRQAWLHAGLSASDGRVPARAVSSAIRRPSPLGPRPRRAGRSAGRSRRDEIGRTAVKAASHGP